MSHEIDSSWEHLFPAFREKLKQVLQEAEAATGHPWIMTEGYRSQERQTFLYDQGRKRPGDIITWQKHPVNHGVGLAADVYPTSNGKTPDFGIRHQVYEQFRDIYLRHGLTNPAWAKGDYGHVQLTDPTIHAKAEAWVAAGFPQTETHSMPQRLAVSINGKPVPPEDAVKFDGRLFVAARAFEDAGVAVVDWDEATGSTAIRVLQRP
jgi:hypothetical protein